MGHGLRERKKLRTRRALAAAALELFAERGFDGTTIADIAAAADVSPRTFFSYFPSKEDVVFAEIDDRLAEVGELLAHRPDGQTPLDTLRAAIVAAVEALVAEHDGTGALQVRLILEHPALQARAMQRLNDTEEQVVALLHELCPTLSSVDAVAAAGVALGGLQSVVIHCRRESLDPDATRAALGRALHVVEHGLRSLDALTAPR